ncbi:hypothetical protein ACIQNG_25495 [Streptomyces sp. NPDC091377]|uniref:hypothetical protein n=1 Tax=Streptomyces sp. NPDC091377 TaxID=3365995 RepID=UPI00382890A5
MLRHPQPVRRLAAHELRGTVVQLLAPGTTDPSWTATVRLLAEAIDVALTRAERAETGGGRPVTRRGRIAEAVVPVLSDRLLREIPGLDETEARRIAAAQAADLSGDGYHVTAAVTTHGRGARPTTPTTSSTP